MYFTNLFSLLVYFIIIYNNIISPGHDFRVPVNHGTGMLNAAASDNRHNNRQLVSTLVNDWTNWYLDIDAGTEIISDYQINQIS